MFTGIIEAIGKISAIKVSESGAKITIETGKLDMSDVKLGDSIATNGVCLTVIDFNSHSYTADVSNETLKRTALANYKAGNQVNLEKAMLPTTRFGGHMVSGHVDAVTQITKIEHNGNSTEYWIALDPSFARYIAEKGSVTIDGVSLTVNAVTKEAFRLTIVPHTIAETIIGNYQVGSKINLEVDVVARYIERLLSADHNEPQPSSGITESMLANAGFIK